MKIIAVVSDFRPRVFLAEVTEHELATIARGSLFAEAAENKIEVGSTVNVRDHWKRVQEIENSQTRLNQASQRLRAVADVIDTIDVVVPPEPPMPAPPVQGGAK